MSFTPIKKKKIAGLGVKVVQLCPTLRTHGLTIQSMEFSKPEYCHYLCHSGSLAFGPN